MFVAADYGRVIEARAQEWAASRASYLPEAWQARALGEWSERRAENEFGGNSWLRELADALREGGGLSMDATDAEIRAAGRDLSASLYELAATCGVRTLPGIRAALEAATRAHGIEPPDARLGDQGACARMLESDWWIRRLRAAHGRRIEFHAVGLGYVHKRAGCYASDVNVRRRREQRARNAAALESVTLQNQYGDEFTLAALAEKSNANPVIRRNELMTRIAGFEGCARALGHVAEFWTATCPSRFHAVSIGGTRNPKFGGATAREAQAHLVGAWAKCRAAMARRGIRPYGFRIAEPHHDGCPHWHLLLFLPAGQRDAARALVRKYFLEQHDAGEAGAAENRVKFVAIDPARGSAAGYVAKYVAKNIDGYKLGQDLWGNDEVTTAERVDAWASTWGIRQFQQIGGAPVGVWRELRRLQDGEALGEVAEAARAAADDGDWAGYVEAMGGPMAPRADMPLSVAYTRTGERFDPVAMASEPAENRYGEPAAPAVYGVREVARDCAHLSRRFRWEVKRGSSRVAFQGKSEAGAASGGARGRPAPGVGFGGSRTRVNNCTQQGVTDGIKQRDQGDKDGGSGGEVGADAVEAGKNRGAGRKNHRMGGIGRSADVGGGG